MCPPRNLVVLLVLLGSSACGALADNDTMEGGSGRSKTQGVTLARGAVAYVGSGAFCSRPATFDPVLVRAACPEWLEMQRDAVPEGSARHSLLRSAMHERMLVAARQVAGRQGYDLVVRTGDITDARGLQVDDLTGAMIAALKP